MGTVDVDDHASLRRLWCHYKEAEEIGREQRRRTQETQGGEHRSSKEPD